MSKLTISCLSELRFTSPDSMINKEGEELTVSKKTLKILMNSLGMVGDKFSKDLYDIDETMWSDLIQKRCASSPFYTDNSAIITRGDIINVVSNSNRDWLLKLEGLIKLRESIEGLSVQTLRESDGFSILCLQDNSGYVISVQIPSKHISVRSISITEEGLALVAPSVIVDCKIDSGINTSDLEALLDHEVLMAGSTEEEFSDFTQYVHETYMSYQDALDALKVIFGIRVKSTIPTPEDYSDKMDTQSYSMPELEFGNLLLKEIYTKAYHYIPTTNWLEKHLKFVNIPYVSLLLCLSSRYLSGNMDFSTLAAYMINASRQSLDHTVVNRVFAVK